MWLLFRLSMTYERNGLSLGLNILADQSLVIHVFHLPSTHFILLCFLSLFSAHSYSSHDSQKTIVIIINSSTATKFFLPLRCLSFGDVCIFLIYMTFTPRCITSPLAFTHVFLTGSPCNVRVCTGEFIYRYRVMILITL